MHRRKIGAGAALATFLLALPSASWATDFGPQQSGSMQVGTATITVGGGVSNLWLPDVEFAKIRSGGGGGGNVTRRVKTSDDFGDEYGGTFSGSVDVPLGGAYGIFNWLSLSGFYASIEDDDTVSCTSSPGAICAFNSIVDGPGADNIAFGAGSTGTIATDRDVDHWGLSLEAKRMLTPVGPGGVLGPGARYVAVAADFRAIEQDLDLDARAQTGTFIADYDEDLDTRYYGAYVAWGGGYTLPFIGGLTSRWGLQSSFLLRGGLYYADTDYDGVSRIRFGAPRTLSLSEEELAFIGGLVLETRKPIGRRAALSLKSEYEYYSWVPDMRYNDVDAGIQSGPNDGTSIGDDDAFSARATLRLTIGLGPDQLYAQ